MDVRIAMSLIICGTVVGIFVANKICDALKMSAGRKALKQLGELVEEAVEKLEEEGADE